MASLCLSMPLSWVSSSTLTNPSSTSVASSSSSSSSSGSDSVQGNPRTRSTVTFMPSLIRPGLRFSISHRKMQIVRMAPEGERMVRRSPLDFPSEYDKPNPGRRPDIFPKFSPMKTPLPPPLPADDPPVEEDEEEEEEQQQEEEGDPEEEQPENPENF